MMKRLKKFWLLSFLLISITLTGCVIDKIPIESNDPIGEREKDIPLSIISINDLHGYIEQEEDGTNGFSNAAYLIEQIRNEDDFDNVILIGNGDMFQGTFISNMTKGRVVIDAMNEMEFDALGIGNHEFDWGIEAILAYFDGNPDNGEADFPLLNANIYLKSDDFLLTVDGGNVFESIVIEREGIKVGLISYIGDVYDSISYDQVEDYYFDLDIKGSVSRIGNEMKEDGVDVIVVNIHGGVGGNNIQYYTYNQQLAELKDMNGNYLVDAVINGHTHRYQLGTISRLGGTPLPVVQAGANGNYFGRITLNYNTKENRVTDANVEVIDVSTAGYQYQKSVEAIIQRYQDEIGNEVLVEAGETITKKDQLYNWIGNVMMAATGADIAFHNTGGVRGTGDVFAGEDITIAQIFEISPFDNPIFVIEATGSELQHIFANNSLFYTMKGELELETTYRVAVISYVYYNYDELDPLRERGVNTELYIRDILVEDLRLKGERGIIFSPQEDPSATIGNLWGIN